MLKQWIDKNKIFDNPVWYAVLLVTLITDAWYAKTYHHISKSILSTFLECAAIYIGLYLVDIAFKRRTVKITKMDAVLFVLIFVVIAVEIPVYVFFAHLPW